MQKSHLFQPVTNVSTFTSSYSYSRLASLVSVSYEQMCGCHNTLKKKIKKSLVINYFQEICQCYTRLG